MAVTESSHPLRAMHRPTVFLLALGAVALASPAQAENTISLQTYKYVESNDRIRVVASDLAIEKDFGTDLTARLDLGVDTISGATPAWRPKPGYVNEYQSGYAKVADEQRHSVNGGLSWRDARRNEYTFGAALSREPDFWSREFSTQAQLWEDDSHNRNWTVGVGLQLNTNLANAHTNNVADEDSRVYNVQAGVNQVIDATSTLEGSIYAGRASGYLSHDYLKIVRDDAFGAHVLAPDARPDTRSSGGIALRWIKSWSDQVKTNLWYRYYSDSWGVTGHTVEAKLYWDISQQWRINPVLRLQRQGSADFYRAYGDLINTFAATGYGTNDARQGAIKAVTGQLNAEYHVNKEWALNAGLVRYVQDTGLRANWLTAGLVYKY